MPENESSIPMPEPMLPPPGEQNGVDPESIQEIMPPSFREPGTQHPRRFRSDIESPEIEITCSF